MTATRLINLLYVALLLCGMSVHRLTAQLRVGAERMELLLPALEGKRVALMANQSSVVGAQQVHLLDTLLSSGVDVRRIFVPEHGFRGTVDAGKYVKDGKDLRTGVPIISLYGRNKKPSPAQLSDVDVVVYDLQDVGTRFYTYISSMHYLMEALSEGGKTLVVCDRPNPNDYVDGPLLEADCRSFVGMHPIPVLHGLTVGELAGMINGEGWLPAGRKCALTVIPIEGWHHGQPYQLPVRPSPNLPDARSVELYPSLCLLEASILSVGRGTDAPFRILGYPHRSFGSYRFVPEPKAGADSQPKHQGKACYGVDLTGEDFPRGQFSLKYILHFHQLAKRRGLKLIDRKRTFEILAGNKRLLSQIEQGMSEAEIRATWQSDLAKYQQMRQRYLLYPILSQ